MHIHMSIKILCTLTLCRNVLLMGMSVPVVITDTCLSAARNFTQ